MNKKGIVLILAILALFVMTGCATQRSWTYKAEPVAKTAPMINKSVAVSPFSDGRENLNKNYTMMYLFPLVPFGWQDLKTPEGVQMHMTSGIWFFKPTEDLAKAIAEELNNSGIFREVFFTNRASEGDLFLKGEIKSTIYNGKLISYGLSFEGPLLWLIGFPAAHVENVLGISLQLVDSKNSEVLWQETYEKREAHTSWIYALRADFLYDRLLKEIMKEAIPSIKNKLATYQRSENPPRIPSGPPIVGPKLSDYYAMLWPMIKEKWQFSKNPPREMVGIEATIVIVIGREGRVQEAWFEKKSGNDLYDDEAMRAIKSAEPFPPLPQELVNDTLKVGVRFYAE